MRREGGADIHVFTVPMYPLRDLKSFLSGSVGGLGMTQPLLLDTRTLDPSSRYLYITLHGLLNVERDTCTHLGLK